MKISTRGRYALRFMIELAKQENSEYTPLKDISEHQNISIKYLEQITSLLSKFGFLSSIRGPQGGYKLTKPASEYTIGSILRITEGNLAPVSCLETPTNTCERASTCQTLKLWEGLNNTVNKYLDSISLADLAQSPDSCDYVI